MPTTTRSALLTLVLAVLLAGCGGGKSSGGSTDESASSGGGGVSGISVGDCLNELNYIVQPSDKVLDGTSPGGVSFTLTLYKDAAAAKAVAAKKDAKTSALVDNAVIDFRGNPSTAAGAPPAKISKKELAQIKGCIDKNK